MVTLLELHSKGSDFTLYGSSQQRRNQITTADPVTWN